MSSGENRIPSAGAPSHRFPSPESDGEARRADGPTAESPEVTGSSPPPAVMTVGTDEATRFIRALTRYDQPGECYTYQTFDDSDAKRPGLAKILHGRGNAAALGRLNGQRAGIFITINATDGNGRQAHNIKRVRAVYVDADTHGAATLAAIRGAGLAPHIVVESSPGKYHIYWLVQRDFPMEKFEAVQRGLIRKFDTDKSVHDLPRVLRLPGFFHRKGAPFKVRIVKLNEHAPYSFEEIVLSLDLILDEAASKDSESRKASTPPSREADKIDPDTERARSESEICLAEAAMVEQGERNDALRDFIYSLRERASASMELCFQFGRRFGREKCHPRYEGPEVDATIRSAIRSAKNPAGSRTEVPALRNAIALNELGVDPEQVEKMATQVQAEGEKPRRFRPISTDEFLQRPAPRWLVPDVLPEGIAVAYGESGSGKSFWALDIGAAIARGVRWRDAPADKGKVLYVAAEGAGGFRNRLHAYKLHNKLDSLDLWIIDGTPNFLAKDDVAELVREVKALGGVKFIVIDTLAQVTPGGNENTAEDMGKALANCKALRHATGATVMLIHHTGKDLTKGARGWSGIKAAADAMIEIQRAGDLRTAHVEKLKEGIDGARYQFRLEVEGLGLTAATGKEVTSCWVSHIKGVAVQRVQDKAPTHKWQKVVWKAFNDLSEMGTENIGMGEVLELAVKRTPLDPEEVKDRRRDRLRTALHALVADGLIQQSDGVGEHGKLVRCKK